MKGYLLDTNVVSEIRKPAAHENVTAWFASVEGTSLYLSALVLGEICQGIARLERRDPAQARVYGGWLELLKEHYSDRILPVTPLVAEIWGRLNVPDPLPTVDGLMVATAAVHGLIFVTRNTRDVQRTGVLTLNPFDVLP